MSFLSFKVQSTPSVKVRQGLEVWKLEAELKLSMFSIFPFHNHTKDNMEN